MSDLDEIVIHIDGTGKQYVLARDIVRILNISGIMDAGLEFTSVTGLHRNATTRDPNTGEPILCGVPLRQLVDHHSYTEAAALVLEGALPDEERLEQLYATLRYPITHIPQELFINLRNTLFGMRSMVREAKGSSDEAIEASASFSMGAALLIIANYYDHKLDVPKKSGEDKAEVSARNIEKSYFVTAHMPLLLALVYRTAKGTLQHFTIPREDQLNDSFAANLAYMMLGGEHAHQYRGTLIEDIFNTLLTITVDGGQNASNTVAEAAASPDTHGNNLFAINAAAIIARSGDKHGGACRAAYQQFLIIRDKYDGTVEERVKQYIDQTMPEGVIYGFGIRVTNQLGTPDPRAGMLRDKIIMYRQQGHLSDELEGLLQIADELNRQMVAHPKFAERPIYPNYDLYSAILLGITGVDPAFISKFMYTGRTPGVMEHVRECVEDRTKIIHPKMFVDPDGPSALKQVEPIMR